MKAIGTQDSTKMELMRQVLLKQLQMFPNYPEEGGDLVEQLETVRGGGGG